MSFIAVLVLIVFAILVYTSALTASPRSSADQSDDRRYKRANSSRRTRGAHRIVRVTTKEVATLVKRREHLFAIDLDRSMTPANAGLADVDVITWAPSELRDLLPWVPSTSAVLLIGSPESLRNIVLSGEQGYDGPAVIYVLETENRSSPLLLRACVVAALFSFVMVSAPSSLAQTAAVGPHALQFTSPSSSSSVAETNLNSLFAEPQSGGYGSGGYRQHPYSDQSLIHHLAIEAGAGFDTPVGNTSKRQTEGFNLKLGGGWNFSQRFGVLLEYEFNRSGIPNAELTAVGAPNGNVHLWGLTLDPIFYLKNGMGWGGYVTGGYGFYRRVTSFTQPINLGYGCDFYGYCYPQYGNQTLSHFSSNQGGGSIGGGITHSLGSGGAKVYAEIRYLGVAAPKSNSAQTGSGRISIIPVTFGIRF